jgi:dolichyl-phosphate beta-glucosyltransferase
MGSVSGIRDTQCGFKLFASERAIGLFDLLKEDGYAFDVELVFLAQQLGIALAEVPVNWTEQPGSKVRVWRDGMRMLKAVRRIRRRWRQGEYRTPGK